MTMPGIKDLQACDLDRIGWRGQVEPQPVIPDRLG